MLFSLTNPEVAILMMGVFLFAVLLGFPIAFTLMAMGIGFGYYAYYDPVLMAHLFDNRIFSYGVFLDLEKAFDTVPHKFSAKTKSL